MQRVHPARSVRPAVLFVQLDRLVQVIAFLLSKAEIHAETKVLAPLPSGG